MAGQNTYLTYKRETAELLYWIIQASNSIIQKTGAEDEDGLSLLNTTGKTTVHGLVSMAKLIAEHIGEQTVPPIIFRLFQSVIEAREATHEFFLQVATAGSDPEIDKSNNSHKHFISALKEAWKALSGVSDASKAEADAGSNPATPQERGEDHNSDSKDLGDDNNVILLANKFASLYLGAVDEEEDEEGADNDARERPPAAASVRKSQKKSNGKGKKKIRGRKLKHKKNPMKPAVPKSTLESIPIESYRIIEDKEGIMTDYLIATYSLTFEWMSLRSFLQKTWKEVAYDGLNSAVAGTLSNVAISMLKRSELAMHVDFLDHDSYHTVVNTITRGDMSSTQGTIKVQKFSFDEEAPAKMEGVTLDIKEQFMIHAYNDLLDFSTDFQENRNGRPTKSMLAQIDKWDPSFDLQRATQKERLKWRRSYTINWLYDLVNLFTTVVFMTYLIKGQQPALEKIDWSTDASWSRHRRLLGLTEFASEVTSLAMHKKGTDVRRKIQPHTVFQLQCIVDSFMVSRGFATDETQGYVLSSPAHQFSPRRDVSLFIGRSPGFFYSIEALVHLFKEIGVANSVQDSHGDKTYKPCMQHLSKTAYEVGMWLGRSHKMFGFDKKVRTSRFRSTNADGLWEYSPFICGVGLMESLEIAYLDGMMVFDSTPEPLLLVHLYNMLVQRGYITEPRGMYVVLQAFFPDTFFLDGKVPTSHFSDALTARYIANSQSCTRNRQAMSVSKPLFNDLYRVTDVDQNVFFKTPSTLVLYRKAAWNYERIPDSFVNPFSLLGALRLGRTNPILDPETGDLRMADTEITRKIRAYYDEERLLYICWLARSMILGVREDSAKMAAEMAILGDRIPSNLPHLRQNLGAGDRVGFKAKDKQLDMDGVHVLEILKQDICADICGYGLSGVKLLSGVNFFQLAYFMHDDFKEIESRLDKTRNPSYTLVYEASVKNLEHKRSQLVKLALSGGADEDCLRIWQTIFKTNQGTTAPIGIDIGQYKAMETRFFNIGNRRIQGIRGIMFIHGV